MAFFTVVTVVASSTFEKWGFPMISISRGVPLVGQGGTGRDMHVNLHSDGCQKLSKLSKKGWVHPLKLEICSRLIRNRVRSSRFFGCCCLMASFFDDDEDD